MAAAPMKIRCYKCGQLIGVGRSKAGTVIPCPRCASDLDVPGLDAFDLADFGPAAPAAAEGLNLIQEAPDEIPESLKEIASRPAPTVKVSESPKFAMPAADVVELERADSFLPNIQVDGSRKIQESRKPAGSVAASRDLLIPRSAVASWSMLVLLAVMFAFMSGLFVGHYVWQVH